MADMKPEKRINDPGPMTDADWADTDSLYESLFRRGLDPSELRLPEARKGYEARLARRKAATK